MGPILGCPAQRGAGSLHLRKGCLGQLDISDGGPGKRPFSERGRGIVGLLQWGACGGVMPVAGFAHALKIRGTT